MREKDKFIECTYVIIGITPNPSTDYTIAHIIEEQADVKMGWRRFSLHMFGKKENLFARCRKFLNDWKGPGVYKCQCAEEYFINKNNEDRKAIKIVKIISHEANIDMRLLLP